MGERRGFVVESPDGDYYEVTSTAPVFAVVDVLNELGLDHL